MHSVVTTTMSGRVAFSARAPLSAFSHQREDTSPPSALPSAVLS